MAKLNCDASKEDDHGLVSREIQPTRLKPRTSWMLTQAVGRYSYSTSTVLGDRTPWFHCETMHTKGRFFFAQASSEISCFQ